MPRPALPHQNRSRIHKLSAKSLDSQPLSMRIPPVRRRPAALLMCHDSSPLLYSCVTQANPAEPVAQVRFVDLRLFSRRPPTLSFRVERPGFFLRTPSYQQNQRRTPPRPANTLPPPLPP